STANSSVPPRLGGVSAIAPRENVPIALAAATAATIARRRACSLTDGFILHWGECGSTPSDALAQLPFLPELKLIKEVVLLLRRQWRSAGGLLPLVDET